MQSNSAIPNEILDTGNDHQLDIKLLGEKSPDYLYNGQSCQYLNPITNPDITKSETTRSHACGHEATGTT